ncbi:MAG: oligosaccharide flippase family protein, partial [Candidatus Binatia bacterium]
MKLVTQVFSTKVADYGLRFVASVIIARYLGPADKGVLAFATLVIALVTTFGSFSLADATVYLVGRRNFSAGEAAAGTFFFSIVAGLLYAAVTFSLVYFGLVNWPVGNRPVFYLLLSLMPFQLVVTHLTSVIQGLNQFKAYNTFTLISSATLLLAVLLVIWVAQNRLIGVAQSMIACAVLNTLLLVIYLIRLAPWRLRALLPFLKQAFHFGVRGHLSVILDTINRRFDQLALGAMINPIELGWYSIAASISELPQLFPDSIGTVLFPRVASNASDAVSLTARACRLTVLAMLVVTVIIVVVATPLISFLYGDRFLPAVKPLMYLAPSIVFLSLSKILTKYIYGIGRPHLVVWATGISAAVTIALIFPLVSRYGMVGAAATSTIAYGVGALCNLI